MTDAAWRIVLVGIGGYGAGYVEALSRLDPAKGRLVAVVDPFAAKSPAFTKVKGLPIHADLAAAIRCEKANIAVLSSPIARHAEQIEMALNAGMHVLCEKPLTATLDQGLKVQRLAEKKKRCLAAGFQWSFAPAILAAKRDVLQGLYGKPKQMQTLVFWPRDLAYYRRNDWAGKVADDSGRPVHDSVLHNATAHYLHNMLFFLGDSLDQAAMPQEIRATLLRAQPIENFDTALLFMRHRRADGGYVSLKMAASHSTLAEKGPQFDYRFERGCIRFSDGSLWGTVNERVIEYGSLGGGEDYDGKIEAILAAAAGEKPLTCHAATALPQVAVIDALQKKVRIQAIEKRLLQRLDRPSPRIYAAGLDDWLLRGLEKGTLSGWPDP